MPFVVQLLAHERPLGRGTAPKVVVRRGGRGRRRADRADAVTRPVNQRMGKADGPSSPLRSESNAWRSSELERLCMPTCTMRPYLRAAATI